MIDDKLVVYDSRKPRTLKFISAEYMREAEQLARDNGLAPGQWIFVPWEDYRRIKALRGIRVDSADDLIGHFSDQERDWLCRATGSGRS